MSHQLLGLSIGAWNWRPGYCRHADGTSAWRWWQDRYASECLLRSRNYSLWLFCGGSHSWRAGSLEAEIGMGIRRNGSQSAA